MSVIITDRKTNPKIIVDPGYLPAPGGAADDADDANDSKDSDDLPPPHPADSQASLWQPQSSPAGPVTILLSAADRDIVALRNGVIIGRAGAVIPPGAIKGTEAFQLLGDGPRGHGGWFHVALREQDAHLPKMLPTGGNGTSRIGIAPIFRRHLRTLLTPGALLVITQESFASGGAGTALTVLASP